MSDEAKEAVHERARQLLSPQALDNVYIPGETLDALFAALDAGEKAETRVAELEQTVADAKKCLHNCNETCREMADELSEALARAEKAEAQIAAMHEAVREAELRPPDEWGPFLMASPDGTTWAASPDQASGFYRAIKQQWESGWVGRLAKKYRDLSDALEAAEKRIHWLEAKPEPDIPGDQGYTYCGASCPTMEPKSQND